MKKSIRILAMLMVAAMLCSMLPVSAFAAGATSADGNVYYTGADYTSDTVAIDGVISAEDGYVDLTPNGVPLTLVNETLEGERWGGDLPTTFTLAEPKAEHIAVGLTTETIVVKYYVAQDDENVYLAIEETMPEKAYTVDGVAYNTNKYLFNNLKLGFNAADPTQQIDFVSDGFWAVQGGASGTKWDVTYTASWTEHPFIVTGLSDTEEFVSKKGPATEIVADYVDEAGAPKDSKMEMVKAEGMVTRTYELKLNKAGIEAAYADVFGATDIGFDSMFVVMSSTDYEWANNDDNYSLLFVTGTVNDGNLISDKVVFGNDPNAPQEYPAALGNTINAGAYDAANVTLDGVVDDAGYAEITPSMSFTDGLIEYGEAIGKEILPAEPMAEHTHADSINTTYYIAQDDDYVYLAVKVVMDKVAYTVDGISYESRSQHLMNLKLGFNPDNYKEQINLYADGFYLTQGGSKTKWDVTYNKTWMAHPFMVTGLTNATEYVDMKTVATDIIADYVDANGNPVDSVAKYIKDDTNNVMTRTFEMKLNKDAIAEAYADVFGTEVSFDQMFIGMSVGDYKWANNKDNSSLMWYNGTVVDADTAAANDTVTAIPDRVVLNEDPNPHVHTPIVDAAVAATCTENGLTEGSHCACGEVLVAQEVVPATGHTEEDVAAVAPTCTETGLTAGKICSVCEETIVAQTVVDATGHAFDDDADATCNNCDYVREVESTDDTTDVADDTTEPEEVTTEPAATEPATTEPATEEVTTKAPETTAPVEEKKGCGSSVSVAGLALVAALGTCTVFVAKKKED